MKDKLSVSAHFPVSAERIYNAWLNSKEHSAFEWVPITDAKEKLTDFFHKEVDIYHQLDLQKLF